MMNSKDLQVYINADLTDRSHCEQGFDCGESVLLGRNCVNEVLMSCASHVLVDKTLT
jgi:hypothetical protein